MAKTGFAVRMASRRGVAADLADLIHSLTRDLSGTYRPERHYMRGPGPKWHAKHDRDTAVDAASQQAIRAF